MPIEKTLKGMEIREKTEMTSQNKAEISISAFANALGAIQRRDSERENAPGKHYQKLPKLASAAQETLRLHN